MIICTNEKCEMKDICRRSAENNKDAVNGTYKSLDGDDCYQKLYLNKDED